ncbi:hypothetical protein pb186bvf_007258 [Paramecium bursaria]
MNEPASEINNVVKQYELKGNMLYINDIKFELDHIIIGRTKQNVLNIQVDSKVFNILDTEKNIDSLFNMMRIICFQSNFKDRYKLVRKLGKGAFGDVYKAKNQENKAFAVKIIKILNGGQSKLQIIEKEIQILRKLNHEICIGLHETFIDKHYVYLVTDYLRGGEFFKFLQKTNFLLEEQVIRDIMQTLFEGLEYIHSEGIMHRDIKPENIFMRSRSNYLDLVIGDFGLAEIYQPQNFEKQKRCGTIGYVAPEILKGEKYDQKCDVFSLGVILYLLITGELPFNEYSQSENVYLANQQTIYDYKLLQDQNVSDDCIDFVEHCLADQENRFTCKEALRHQWFKVHNFNSKYKLESCSIRLSKQVYYDNTADQDFIIQDSCKFIQDMQDDCEDNAYQNTRDYQFIK